MHTDRAEACQRLQRVTIHVLDHDARGAPRLGESVPDVGPVLRARRLEELIAERTTLDGLLTPLEGGARREQVRGHRRDGFRELLERRDVRDPEATAMRRRDQLGVARMDLEVVHRHVRQTGHELLPGRAAVAGEVGADIRAHEEQVLILGVFTHHVHEVRRATRQSARDRAEGAPGVIRHEEVRREIAASVVVVRDVKGAEVELRGLDARDVRASRNAGHARRELLPVPAVVRRHPEAAVVGAGVEIAGEDRGFVERDDRAEELGAGRVDRDAAGGAA